MASPREAVAASVDDLSVLLEDWKRHLRGVNKAPSTVASYLTVGENFRAYLVAHGMPTTASAITRDHVEAFMADLLDRLSPPTAAKHYRSLQQLWRWLLEDGEIQRSPMERMRPPTVPEQPVPILSEDELSRLLAACKGDTFENRRDNAIIRPFLDTGMRASELVGMTSDDIDWDTDVVLVMGKGRRGRGAPFGAKTADALRRYRRVRARHPMAQLPAIWLGKKGPMTDSGVRQMLERRGKDAGIEGLHPHRFRHTFAHRWLAEGGQEQDLMRLCPRRPPPNEARRSAVNEDDILGRPEMQIRCPEGHPLGFVRRGSPGYAALMVAERTLTEGNPPSVGNAWWLTTPNAEPAPPADLLAILTAAVSEGHCLLTLDALTRIAAVNCACAVFASLISR